MTPDERRFAELVLGKVIRTERETLEWVAQFSDRHAAELRDSREAEAAAQRDPASAGPGAVWCLVIRSGATVEHCARARATEMA